METSRPPLLTSVIGTANQSSALTAPYSTGKGAGSCSKSMVNPERRIASASDHPRRLSIPGLEVGWDIQAEQQRQAEMDEHRTNRRRMKQRLGRGFPAKTPQ